jgi:hypothetical protein
MLQYNSTKIACDSVAFCPSGLYDTNRKSILSWLHKAIKPLNLLRMMEDSCVIYRISRAPERRVFYIDVGNLPKGKAEQYIESLMTKYKNKLVYDVATGEMRDDRKFMSMMEDFWLPRREGGKGTEIQTLPAGQNLSEMEDVDYFRKKLYRALGLPPSRIDQGTGFSLGRSTEISRDELNFNKFIHRLQSQFSTLFDQMLERQLRLKNILTEQEWYRIKDSVRYTWQTDSYFEELKNQEIWTSRLTLVGMVEPYIDKYFSNAWVSRELLKLTEDESAAMRSEFTTTNSQLAGKSENPFAGGDGDEKHPTDNPFSDEGEGLDAEADDLLKDDESDGDTDEVDFNPDQDEKNADPDDDDDDLDQIDADLDADGDEDVDDVKLAADKVAEDEDDEDDKDTDSKSSKKPPFGKKS